MTRFRAAKRADVPAIVAMLREDALGDLPEGLDLSIYFAAFDAMQAEHANSLFVGEQDGQVVATYQLTVISGLSLRASRRAQVESVRVTAGQRGQGIGRAMMADAEARARAAGCTLMQLTSNADRAQAIAFYRANGFSQSHVGFKRRLE